MYSAPLLVVKPIHVCPSHSELNPKAKCRRFKIDFLIPGHGESSPQAQIRYWSDCKDPLAEDTLPPRYAIESDDEDEFNPLNHQNTKHPEIQVTITTKIPTNVNLIIASGIAGKIWARGANLKEQFGIISVNGVKVILNPTIVHHDLYKLFKNTGSIGV